MVRYLKMILIRSSVFLCVIKYKKKKNIKNYINNSKVVVYPLFIDYSTISFIPYFSKSTLTVLNNHDNSYTYIKYIKRNYKISIIS